MEIGEAISNLIAVIALIFSFFGWRQAKKAEKAAHEFDLFRDTYQEHLVKKIPEIRSRIIITQNGNIMGLKVFIDELNSIRKDSLYFQYAEPPFFEELRDKLWELEDYLIMLEEPLVEDMRQEFEYQMQTKITEIYKYILKRF